MLRGVGLARRRRVHYHGEVAAEHGHHHYSHHYAHDALEGPALAALIRLEEKLRGAALPGTSTSTSPSRWSRLMRDGRSTPPRHPQQITPRDEQDTTLPSTGASPEPELWRPAPPPTSAATLLQHAAASSSSASTQRQRQRQRRAELTRTLSKVDVCAVCLDEVRPDGAQRVTRLPCSHKYHSECVLPWLAVHPDCPCCRALVPSADTLVQVGDS